MSNRLHFGNKLDSLRRHWRDQSIDHPRTAGANRTFKKAPKIEPLAEPQQEPLDGDDST